MSLTWRHATSGLDTSSRHEELVSSLTRAFPTSVVDVWNLATSATSSTLPQPSPKARSTAGVHDAVTIIAWAHPDARQEDDAVTGICPFAPPPSRICPPPIIDVSSGTFTAVALTSQACWTFPEISTSSMCCPDRSSTRTQASPQETSHSAPLPSESNEIPSIAIESSDRPAGAGLIKNRERPGSHSFPISESVVLAEDSIP